MSPDRDPAGRRYVVRGRRPFPLALLAVDRAWPATSLDARTIEVSLRFPDDHEVALRTDAGRRPGFAAWAEHGWTVTEVEGWDRDEWRALIEDYADGGRELRAERQR